MINFSAAEGRGIRPEGIKIEQVMKNDGIRINYGLTEQIPHSSTV
jgi:hypothetical protein